MPELKGIDYLRRKLDGKRTRVDLRYKHYEMKAALDIGATIIPTQFINLKTVLGWCAKSVDTLADRLLFDSFDDDNFYLGEIFNLNNRDILCDSMILSALISSCSFVYIAKDESGYPRLQVIDGGNATGRLDTTTNLLYEGYAVIERDETGVPLTEGYFLPGETQFYRRGKLYEVFTYSCPHPLLVPVIYRQDARRPFGHSRISRSNMSMMMYAARVLWRSEVSAEFYSFPQKYVLGMDPDAEWNKKLATISSFLKIDKDDDGEHPVVGQFQQQSMLPYTEQLKMIASVFAGENGLTLDDLGFSTANPTTKEAIEAAHENLRVTALKAQRSFGSAILNIGYLAACVRDKHEYDRQQFYETKPSWLPIFSPSLSDLGALGDAVGKMQQAFPDYFDEDKLHRLTGL